MTAASSPPSRGQDSLIGCLVRLTWMAGATVLIFICAVLIAEGRSVVGVSAELLLWLAAALAIVVRFVDVRFFAGQTTEGQPATLAHWRRYTVIVLAVTAALWVAARLLSHVGLFG